MPEWETSADDPSTTGDLSLFEAAMAEIDDGTPKNEYSVMSTVIGKLSKEFGIDINPHDGRDIASPMGLNNRVEDFRNTVGGLPVSIGKAIQENQFTEEMADKVLEIATDEPRLFTRYDTEVAKMREKALDVMESLLYLGQSKYGKEEAVIQIQKDVMIADIRSYDRMISTFTQYINSLDEYIRRRVVESNMPVDLNKGLSHWLKTEESEEKIAALEALEKKYPGYKEKQTAVDKKIREALEAKGGTSITVGELRAIVRAYKDSVKIELSTERGDNSAIPTINYHALERCLGDIEKS